MRNAKLDMLALLLFLLLLLPYVAFSEVDPDKQFRFLQEAYNRHDKNLSEFLVSELTQFTLLFPESERTPEAQYLIGKVHQEKGNKLAAFAAFLKTMYLYPGSSWQQESAKEARKIVMEEGAFKDTRTSLLAALDSPGAGATPAERYYDYLKLAATIGRAELCPEFIADTRMFVSRFPEETRLDDVWRWQADFYALQDEYREANLSYLRLDYCCPESPHLPYARYTRGMLLSKNLGDHKQALEVLAQVVANHPQSEFAAAALFSMAEIKQDKTKDYAGALADYRKFADTDQDSIKTAAALLAIAEINANNLKDYTAAIAAYHEIVEKHGGNNRGPQALEKAGDLYKDKLNDPAKAAEHYAAIAEQYPYDDKATDMLLKAGAVMEDKAKDYKKAIEYYSIILEKFPNHKNANEARKRIEKAQSKTGE